MTVREVFDLRKQGKIEEAYEAIRPMYAVHKGKYTTLCMFWTASDILKKRVREGRLDEAERIFEALLRILPHIEDKEGRALSSILHEAVLLDREIKTFSMLDFVERLRVERLSEKDWETIASPAVADTLGHPIPSVAQQLLICAFHEIQEEPTVDNALKVMPLLQEAVHRHSHNQDNLLRVAMVYRIMGEREKAAGVYQQLLRRYHDSGLYAELAELTDDADQKAALFCQAIRNERQEKGRTDFRLELARLLIDRDGPKAAYELQKCVTTRKALGFDVTPEMQQMLRQLSGVQPVTDAAQQEFYKKMAEKYATKK